MKRNSSVNSSAAQNRIKTNYLEIYIEEDGRLIFTPLTPRSLPVVKAISDKAGYLQNFYCG